MKIFYNRKSLIFLWFSLICALLLMIAIGRIFQTAAKAATERCKTTQAAIGETLVEAINSRFVFAKDQLTTLSKVPIFKRFKKKPVFAPEIVNAKTTLSMALYAYQFEIGIAYRNFLIMQSNMSYLGEIPMALWRRLAHEALKLAGVQDHTFFEIDHEPIIINRALNITEDKDEINRIYYQSSVARGIVLYFQLLVSKWFEPIIKTANILDKFGGFGHSVLVNSSEATSFFYSTMSDNNIFSILQLGNNFGMAQLELFKDQSVSRSILPPIDYKTLDRQSYCLKKNSRLLASKHKLMQAMATIRGIKRKPVGFIRGLIDLSFLDKLVEGFQDTNEFRIQILDADYMVIADSDSKNSINKISHLKNLVFGKTKYVISNSQIIFITNLTNFSSPDVPDWQIAIISPDYSGPIISPLIGIFALIVLAAAGGFALFYTAVKFNGSNYENDKNDK